MPIASQAQTRTYNVVIDFLSGNEIYASEDYLVEAASARDAERHALQLAANSHYDDPRIPDFRRLVREVAATDVDPTDDTVAELSALLTEASIALSACLDDLDAWASCGPVGYSPEERARRDAYEVMLGRIAAPDGLSDAITLDLELSIDETHALLSCLVVGVEGLRDRDGDADLHKHADSMSAICDAIGGILAPVTLSRPPRLLRFRSRADRDDEGV